MENLKKAGRKMWIVILMVCVTLNSGCAYFRKDKNEEKIQVSVSGYHAIKDAPNSRYDFDMKVEEWFEDIYRKVDIVGSDWTFDPHSYLAKAEGGTLPTVYYVPMTEAYNIIRQGYAANVTEEYIKRGYYGSTRDFILENISENGQIYLIPMFTYDLGLFMDIEVCGKAGLVAEDGTPYQPKTWEETAELARKIKDKTGYTGFVFPTSGLTAGWMFMPIAWNYGTVFEAFEDGRWKAKFNSPECAAALQFIKDLKWKYDVLQEEQLADTNAYRRYVAENKCGFAFADESGIWRMIEYGMDRDRVGMVSMPAGPACKATLVGGGYSVINKDATAEEIKAAMDWVEYSCRPVKMNDAYKKKTDEKLKSYDEMGQLIGIESVGLWEDTAEAEQYLKQKNKEMLNVNYNHIKLYNDKSTVELKLEEPIEAQMLYDILGNVINKVITDENADPAELLEAAANEFQTKYLDYAN